MPKENCQFDCLNCKEYMICFFDGTFEAHPHPDDEEDADLCEHAEDCPILEPEQLADAHWEYINALLDVHIGGTDLFRETIKFHYRSAFIHGYKHGSEDYEKCLNCQETHLL